MIALAIALKDLLIQIKDRGLLFQLFLLPAVFVIGFSFVFSAAGAEEEITLPVVNLDPGGDVSQTLLAELDASNEIQVKLYTAEEANGLLDEGDIDRLLTIPAGFSNDVDNERHTSLTLVQDPGANEQQSAVVQGVIESIARNLSLETQLISAFRKMDQMMAIAPAEYQVFTGVTIENQARGQFERSRQTPLLSVAHILPTAFTANMDELGVQSAVSGFLVLFVFLTAQTTAQSIYEEKKVGSFRRLLAAPIGKLELLAGKMIPNLINTLLQIVVMLAIGVFVLPLLGMDRLSLGRNPFDLVVLSLLVALCSTSLGVLIAALARTGSQISGYSQVALWIMGALGGSLMPRFIMGDTLNALGKVTPHSWAIEAYYDLLMRGKGLADITTQLAVLAGFTLVFLAVGLWRFRYES